MIVGALVAIVAYLVHNTSENLAARHIATGFGFLGRVAGIPIGEHMLPYDPAVNTYGRALLIGILNTLKVAVVGIVLATILGTADRHRAAVEELAAGQTRRAVRRGAARHPACCCSCCSGTGCCQALPAVRQAFNPVPGVFLSNRGLKRPALDWEPAHSWAVAAFLVGLIGTIAWSGVARKRQAKPGCARRSGRWRWPADRVPVLVWAALGAPFTSTCRSSAASTSAAAAPSARSTSRSRSGLVIYTASYIAEIVRSGIQAVPQGQWEAAGALGLRPGAVLRQIVLPQALRVVIPPMTSQYLNLTKNSSLAVAIGYQDVVSIDQTTLNQTGQAIEGIALVMAVFLTISLSISLFMNWYNARIALVER